MILNRSVRSQYSDSSLAHPASSFASRVPSSSRRPSSPPPRRRANLKKISNGLRSPFPSSDAASQHSTFTPPPVGYWRVSTRRSTRSSARCSKEVKRAASPSSRSRRDRTDDRDAPIDDATLARAIRGARCRARARRRDARGENDGGVVRCLRRVRVDARRARRGPRAVHEPRAAEDGGG